VDNRAAQRAGGARFLQKSVVGLDHLGGVCDGVDMPTVYAVQFNIVWESRGDNHKRVAKALAAAKPAAGSLIVLPEMFDVGFTMNADLAVAGTGETSTFCAELAREYRSHVVAGFADRDAAGRCVNQARVFDSGGTVVGQYIKSHPFTIGGEHEHYAAGPGPIAFEWAGLRVAPIICYDLRFPELFRRAALAGTELFAVIANFPSSRVDHWITLNRARAIENQAYVVAVNRCGKDPKLAYPGRSMVIDPKGAVLADAGDRPAVIAAPIDLDALRAYRQDFGALRDVRRDFISV
jgi:omega-amidase